MANLKDLLVNGVTRFIGKVYAPTPEAGKYIAYKTQIEQAQTVDEVNNISLDYSL